MQLKFSSEEFPGIFVTFCGVDGTGKTTMINMLSEKFEGIGYRVLKTKQPTDAVRQSELFRRFVDTGSHDGLEYRSLSLLTVSDRVQHSTQEILPRLRKGEVVISDRYFYSALVNLRARGYKDDQWIYEIARYLPCPDRAIFLNIDFDISIERVRQRPEEKNKWLDVEFQRKLHHEFNYVCVISNGIQIDSSSSPKTTFSKVWQAVMPLLEKKPCKVV